MTKSFWNTFRSEGWLFLLPHAIPHRPTPLGSVFHFPVPFDFEIVCVTLKLFPHLPSLEIHSWIALYPQRIFYANIRLFSPRLCYLPWGWKRILHRTVIQFLNNFASSPIGFSEPSLPLSFICPLLWQEWLLSIALINERNSLEDLQGKCSEKEKRRDDKLV